MMASTPASIMRSQAAGVFTVQGTTWIALCAACTFSGSAQESDRRPILRGLPESDEFGFGGSHALGFEQQVVEVLVTAPASDQHLDVAVDCFDDTERRLHVAVVQNAVQMIQQHQSQL